MAHWPSPADLVMRRGDPERSTGQEKEAIRCCIACIFPCGALDVIRIVHASGRVEETRSAVAFAPARSCWSTPQHVLLETPSPSPSDSAHKVASFVLPPHAELQRGKKIYFIVPAAPEKIRSGMNGTRRRREEGKKGSGGGGMEKTRLLLNERYLSEKASTARDRRRGRVGVWRSHLESISEICSDP